MALDKSILKTEILKITDASNPIHEGFPASIVDATTRWSNAIDKYASQVLPLSSSSGAAKTQLAIDLIPVGTVGTTAFITAFTNYAAILSIGMSPTFTGVPPPIPIVLEPIFTFGFAGASSDDIAELLSTTIDVWFKTGTAINVGSGAIINWN